MPNHEISLAEAIEMTTRYRANRPDNFPISETFAIEAISKLMSAEGCSGIRIYYGMKEDLEAHAILVAVNAEGEDILPLTGNGSSLESSNPLILEDAIRCPPDCPKASVLNSD